MEIINLCDERSCTQCTACIEICPKGCIIKKTVDSGFFIPQIKRELCIECGLCMKSCHVINSKISLKKPSTVYASWNKDDTIRCLSSSGGVFSVFAEYIIRKGGIVFGAVYTSELDVVHLGVETISDLQRMRGSKYVQSDINGCYRKIHEELKKDRYVLFTGTPCQVAGLYSFLKKEYLKLYTCDFICHGVPSQKAFDLYLGKIGLSKVNTSDFKFRYTKGWGFQLSCGEESLALINTYYLKAFTKGYMFMESCYSCQYAKIERISDITMADFWGIGDKVPFFHSKNKGVSLLLVNTEKGMEVINKCSNMLFLEERTLKEAICGNYNLSHSSTRPMERNTFYKDSVLLTKSKLIKKYNLSPSLRDYLRPIKRKLQSFIQK